MELALRALRHRDRSRRELDQRLAKAGIEPAERAETLDRLATSGLVSDKRFAAGRARSLAARGAGDDLIRTDLRRRGVASDAVEHAVADLDPEEVRAAELHARRGGDAKALRYLAGKGFSRETLEGIGGALPVD
ncbi:MAG TPA: regulatory protein RecX [Gaiellaceae bacterium]|nr:regulatory protein RecX [Gaiellaceae bacterium]